MSDDIHGYESPGCAYCPSTVRACRQGEGDEREQAGAEARGALGAAG